MLDISTQMGNTYASPGDPIFFVHHAMVDRLWTKWQAKGT